MLILAQNLAEYSALSELAGSVQRASAAAQDWLEHVDSRIWMVGGFVAVVWLARRLFSGGQR
jgi:hypothetical protein